MCEDPRVDHTKVPAWWLLGGAAALAIGSFLPWAVWGPFSKNGTDGDGIFTLILAVVIAFRAWPTIRTSIDRARSVTITIAASVALVICLFDIADVSSRDLQVGTGLLMATAGAVAVLVGVVVGTQRKVVRFSDATTPRSGLKGLFKLPPKPPDMPET